MTNIAVMAVMPQLPHGEMKMKGKKTIVSHNYQISPNAPKLQILTFLLKLAEI